MELINGNFSEERGPIWWTEIDKETKYILLLRFYGLG